MSLPFSTSFERPIARDNYAHPIERALLRLSESAAIRQGVYKHPTEFVRIPSDPAILAESHDIAERVWTSRLRAIVLIGIGGSNLGAKAVAEALTPVHAAHTRRPIELFSLDTCEPRFIERALSWVDERVTMPEEIAIVVGTKSGTTAETLINADVLLGHLRKKDPAYEKRVIVISDFDAPTNSYAQQRGFLFAPIPKPIGGRWSVFTPVGLIPLALFGVDINELRKGAQEMFSLILSGRDASAVRFAREIATMQRAGIHLLDLFFFDPAFESLGKWARQLISESLGKKHDRDGRTVHAGVTPTVSIGSTDLHSMAQLVYAGPRDKWTMLVTVKGAPSHFTSDGFISLAHFNGRSAEEVFRAIVAGTRAAYAKNDLPLLDVELPAASPFVVGAWMAWMMAAVYIAGEILNIDPFDQPAVEDYKQATKAYLAHHRR